MAPPPYKYNHSSAFTEDSEELIDAEPLHFSGDSDLGSFDFSFDEMEEDDFELRNGHDNLDGSSVTTDFLFEDSALDQLLIYNAPDKPPHKQQINVYDQFNLQQLHLPQYQTSSLGEQSIYPFTTKTRSTTGHQHSADEAQKIQCRKAVQLQKLFESMKRTEESRRHVMMHRSMLTKEQQLAIHLAKEQLAHQNERAQSGFFSGSRSTLTNGLEQSRMQLSLYVGQMANKTL